MTETEPSEIRRRPVTLPRTPQRRNGRKKFERLLDTLETLLESRETNEITLADLSQAAEVPTASVYHFFPNRDAAFAALTQRHFATPITAEVLFHPREGYDGWQQLIGQLLEHLLIQFESSIPRLKIRFGPTPCWATRELLIESNRQVAALLQQGFAERFVLPPESDWREHFLMAVTIADAFWSLSFSRSGYITRQSAEEARRAVVAYLRMYLADDLAPRQLQQDASSQPATELTGAPS